MLRYWKWQDLCASLVLFAGGVIMLVKPKLTLEVMASAVGVLLIIVGLIFMLAYFVRRKSQIIGYDLILGIVITALGIFVCIRTGFVVSILPVIFGICIGISGLLKLQRGLDLKRMKINSWGYIIILALASILLGTIVILNPFSTAVWLMRLIGISFIYCGVTDFITAVYVSWKYSHFIVNGRVQEPDITLEKTDAHGEPDAYYDTPDDGSPASEQQAGGPEVKPGPDNAIEDRNSR